MQQDAKYGLADQLISDILSQQDILVSVNSGGGSIAEARVEKGLPFRIREKWATIGDEDRQWHIHLNLEEVIEARFVKEPRSDGKVLSLVNIIAYGSNTRFREVVEVISSGSRGSSGNQSVH